MSTHLIGLIRYPPRRGLRNVGANAGGTQRRRGFTLVEVMTVLAMLTILAAILLPVLQQARDRAYRTACLSNVRQIAQAHQLYLTDFDERLPHWFFAAPPQPPLPDRFCFWTEYLQPYLRSRAILCDPRPRWPWDSPQEQKLADYALGTWGKGGRGTARSPYWFWPGPPFTLAEVRRPTQTICLMDGWTTSDGSSGWTGMDLYRHNGGVNAAFLDGHVGWLPTREFWRVATDETGFHFYLHVAVDR